MQSQGQKELKKLYRDIRVALTKLVPEKWEGIYLYASVLGNEGGEMYFYYIPKKLIRHKAINCYEIASRFGIDDIEYNEALEKLYKKIKKLHLLSARNWTNVTMIIEGDTFTCEYHYNNIAHSMYTDDQRHLVWCYKNLHIPLDTLSDSDQILVKNYEEESSFKPTIYKENIEESDSELAIHNQILKF